ncbi:benzoylformate decarboxylase [Aurantiacibacter xanthus]|uniref:Benzoylformate decarboxylase n=1 Tax=Aurantiacibacter xanthus TaxID=1784712 RepID=A0A3A1P517_9SPHN|nr:benzoylformate decarboxylase [Aurantiacibacter xanthus]RIV82241.1 benzoylformate decarboxylase [Aurantiacibacter xanthus]
MAAPTVREVTIDLLRQLGITKIFGNPGSTELPMFRDFPADMDYVLGLQEASVLAMADGYALATRNAALVNLHSSAGTGHALGNLFTAYKNYAPVIVTAGQQARSILPFEPFLHAARPTEFPQPFVKWACEPARAEDVPLAIARAYRIAMTPPFGPTFVSVPVDDWDKPCEPLPRLPRVATTNPGDPAALVELARALGSASRAALVLGADCARSQAWDAALALAERHQLAVYSAPHSSRNVFPENHPLFQGFIPASRSAIMETLGKHDLVISAGGPLHLYHTEGAGPHVPDDTGLWLIANDPNLLSFAPADRAILADCRSALERLAVSAEPNARATPLPPRPAPPLTGDTLDAAAAFACIARMRPTDSAIVEEAPSTRAIMQQQMALTGPDQFFTTASGGLGYALPAAVGVALANPDRKIIAIIGDGSFMYSEQALFSAAQLGTPVSFLVINNKCYAALREFGRHFQLGKVEGTDLTGLDFCALAKGHNVAARSAVSVAELEEALAWSFAADGPTLVEIVLAEKEV